MGAGRSDLDLICLVGCSLSCLSRWGMVWDVESGRETLGRELVSCESRGRSNEWVLLGCS
jgi:hypothetical protein